MCARAHRLVDVVKVPFEWPLDSVVYYGKSHVSVGGEGVGLSWFTLNEELQVWEPFEGVHRDLHALGYHVFAGDGYRGTYANKHTMGANALSSLFVIDGVGEFDVHFPNGVFHAVVVQKVGDTFVVCFARSSESIVLRMRIML